MDGLTDKVKVLLFINGVLNCRFMSFPSKKNPFHFSSSSFPLCTTKPPYIPELGMRDVRFAGSQLGLKDLMHQLTHTHTLIHTQFILARGENGKDEMLRLQRATQVHGDFKGSTDGEKGRTERSLSSV